MHAPPDLDLPLSSTISPGINQMDSLRRRARRPSSRKIHRSVSVDKRIEARVPLMRFEDFVTSLFSNEISCAQGEEEAAVERDRGSDDRRLERTGPLFDFFLFVVNFSLIPRGRRVETGASRASSPLITGRY